MSSSHHDNPLKRRSRSPPPWRREQQRPRNDSYSSRSSQKKQTELNALQEAEQARQWVSQEDHFVLLQSKKKAEIRVKEGRAKPIDYLAVNLRVIDEDRPRNTLDDDIPDEELDIVDPEGILDGLSKDELEDLLTDIETYISLETNKANSEFWKTMKILTVSRLSSSSTSRAVSSVASDIDKLLSTKSLSELTALETQITAKLSSNEPIDVDYWTELLRSLRIWKAKASLKAVYSKVISSRLEILRKQQREEAATVRSKLESILRGSASDEPDANAVTYRSPVPVVYSRLMDPEPLLKLNYSDKPLETLPEKSFLQNITADRKKILKLGYVPHKPRASEKSASASTATSLALMPAPPIPSAAPTTSRFATVFNDDDFTAATAALYEREVARGISDNEEIFTAEETLSSSAPPSWASKYRPRKPRYFNRVQMGYEWNKYNQTHYDHDNPPPKVVQGYKFNIFYPDLIDKSKAPTYRIEREGGRKRGQSFAPAGEEDTCLIRFVAGPPYEDVAFRIVDKEWDYSAKRERGFKSSFEKGILQLHFQLKKIYYRK